VCDAVNTLLATVAETDFSAVGRTAVVLGLAGMSADVITQYLHDGPPGRSGGRVRAAGGSI
jgi:hypothetical protein